MNEVTRPLEQIENEIDFYKGQFASNTIEIGKRLIEAKGQVKHGEWGKWLEEKVNFSHTSAKRFMQVAKEFSNSPALGVLNQTKIFALLEVPQEERESFMSDPHQVNGETKTVDEMTTRQLQQAIKDKKALEESNKVLEQSFNDLSKKYSDEVSKPPATVEVEIEVDNTDYTVAAENKLLEDNLKKLSSEKDDLQIDLQLMTNKADAYEQDSLEYKQMKEDIVCLTQKKDDLGRQIAAITSISGLVIEIDHLIKDKLAPVRYSKSLLGAKEDEIVLRNLTDMVETIEQWCSEMRRYIPSKIDYVEVII